MGCCRAGWLCPCMVGSLTPRLETRFSEVTPAKGAQPTERTAQARLSSRPDVQNHVTCLAPHKLYLLRNEPGPRHPYPPPPLPPKTVLHREHKQLKSETHAHRNKSHTPKRSPNKEPGRHHNNLKQHTLLKDSFGFAAIFSRATRPPE